MPLERYATGNAALSRGEAPAPRGGACRVLQANSADGPAWNRYVAATATAELYHDFRWRELIEQVFGHETHYLLARADDDGVRGVLPLVRLKSRLFGDFLVSVPYVNYGGVLADSAPVREALVAHAADLARELGAEHIELRHRTGLELDGPVREDKVTLCLELPESADALWEGFKPKLRSQIRRPMRAGATARQGGLELLDAFYSVFARNMRDLGTPVYPKRFFAAILTAFPSEATLHVVDLAGVPVAAGLVLAHRNTLEIPWASSLRDANRSAVNMLLYWRVLESAIERGFERFDFGRSTLDSGPYRFKRQWGAEPEPLRWHYWLADGKALPRLTPSNPKYRAAIALWRKLPVPLANLLGPRIVKYLP